METVGVERRSGTAVGDLDIARFAVLVQVANRGHVAEQRECPSHHAYYSAAAVGRAQGGEGGWGRIRMGVMPSLRGSMQTVSRASRLGLKRCC